MLQVIQEKDALVRRLTQQAETRAAELPSICNTPRSDTAQEVGHARPGKEGKPPLEDRAALLRRLAAAAAENRELSTRLEQMSDEYETSKETLEQLLQLQASSERNSMRQIAGLLRSVQALAARSQQHSAPPATGDAAADGSGGEDGRQDRDRARASGAMEVSDTRAEADWSVEHSLQRLVMSMGEQIREKAALIGRLEAGAARDGGDLPATPSRQAQLAAARQLQTQLADLRHKRDEVKREMAEAERRLSAIRSQEATAAQPPRGAPRPQTAPGPTIKIKEPLRQGDATSPRMICLDLGSHEGKPIVDKDSALVEKG